MTTKFMLEQAAGISCARCGAYLGRYLTNCHVEMEDWGLRCKTSDDSQIHEGERPGHSVLEHRCPTPGWFPSPPAATTIERKIR